MSVISEILKSTKFDYSITVCAWIKTVQAHLKILFININDGSSINNLQVIYKQEDLNLQELTTGTAIKVVGTIKKSQGKDQTHELLADSIEVLASADSAYPIQKKNMSLEYLREVCHQRHRTKLFHAISIIKKETIFAIHEFFYKNHFFQILPPILTTNNCEGGSDAFELSRSGEDFFKKPTLLSVSGQFYLEASSLGFKSVYTLSPTFRAEKSNSSHHLAEFWMLEIEKSFCKLQDLLVVIENFLKYVTSFVLENCQSSLLALQDLIPENGNLIEKLNDLVKAKFQVIEYKKAIEILKEDIKKGQVTFINHNIEFGMNLSSEHERYLAETVFAAPVFVINYPKDIKAFYMKQNSDNLTVSAVDLLAPYVGELIGGSERETDVEKIKQTANKKGIDLSNLEWYLDLRKYGYHTSSGFGLGFERLLMYFTGCKNIKDIPSFPRTYQQINF